MIALSPAILAQAVSVPLLEVPAVADRDLDAARRAYERAGVPDETIVRCDSRRDALRAIEAGKRARKRQVLGRRIVSVVWLPTHHSGSPPSIVGELVCIKYAGLDSYDRTSLG